MKGILNNTDLLKYAIRWNAVAMCLRLAVRRKGRTPYAVSTLSISTGAQHSTKSATTATSIFTTCVRWPREVLEHQWRHISQCFLVGTSRCDLITISLTRKNGWCSIRNFNFTLYFTHMRIYANKFMSEILACNTSFTLSFGFTIFCTQIGIS